MSALAAENIGFGLILGAAIAVVFFSAWAGINWLIREYRKQDAREDEERAARARERDERL